VRAVTVQKDRLFRKGGGRRSPTKTQTKVGHYIRSTPVRRNNDLAFDATIRAAAPKQIRRSRSQVAIALEGEDIREKIRERRMGNLLAFVVDASGSMGDLLMKTAKGAIMSLLEDAYQKRDKVGLVAFRESSAEVLLPPTNSIELVKNLLEDLPTGGKTPLAHGLVSGYELIQTYLRKDDNVSPLLILISDCRPNVGLLHGRVSSSYYEAQGFGKIRKEIFRIAEGIRNDGRIHTLIIDVTERMNPNYMGRDLAEAMGAQYFRVHELKAKGIVRLIRHAMAF
ncbi:MAG: VWA domain-containing protein, partial [Candidatus Tectomicrobia bacterium]|nr:VWA domain-containing protein [Candidatus Tectomicrobia bacterium]